MATATDRVIDRATASMQPIFNALQANVLRDRALEDEQRRAQEELRQRTLLQQMSDASALERQKQLILQKRDFDRQDQEERGRALLASGLLDEFVYPQGRVSTAGEGSASSLPVAPTLGAAEAALIAPQLLERANIAEDRDFRREILKRTQDFQSESAKESRDYQDKVRIGDREYKKELLDDEILRQNSEAMNAGRMLGKFWGIDNLDDEGAIACLLYTSPSPRD